MTTEAAVPAAETPEAVPDYIPTHVILDGIAYYNSDFDAMNMADLRVLARKHYVGTDKTVISYMRKDKLIDLLMTGIEPGVPEVESPKLDFDKPVVKTEPKGNGGNGNGDLADVLAKALSGKIKAGVDESQVRAIVEEMVGGSFSQKMDELADKIKKIIDSRKKTLTVKLPGKPAVDVGRQHKAFPSMMKLAAARLDMFLVGPAGVGKTYACEQVAKALDIPFSMCSVGLQTTKTDLLGYLDVRGNYIPSLLRKAYENGGVFTMDEIDAGNANVLTVINAMLANEQAAFPDKMVPRHKDFVFIACGNTYGHGGDILYVGRNQIDAATLDRFVMVEFGYDEKLEETFTDDAEWLDVVSKVRKAVAKLKEKVIVSPRATIKGTMMRKMGYGISECLDMLVYRGVSGDVKARIEAERKRM